jgi:hypothetical protein
MRHKLFFILVIVLLLHISICVYAIAQDEQGVGIESNSQSEYGKRVGFPGGFHRTENQSEFTRTEDQSEFDSTVDEQNDEFGQVGDEPALGEDRALQTIPYEAESGFIQNENRLETNALNKTMLETDPGKRVGFSSGFHRTEDGSEFGQEVHGQQNVARDEQE